MSSITLESKIENPLHRGQRITLPKGTVVRSANPRHAYHRVLARPQEVVVHSVFPGYIDTSGWEREKGKVLLPSISWAGTKGYWQDVQVTPELAEELGVELVLPVDTSDMEVVAQMIREGYSALPGLTPDVAPRWVA